MLQLEAEIFYERMPETLTTSWEGGFIIAVCDSACS